MAGDSPRILRLLFPVRTEKERASDIEVNAAGETRLRNLINGVGGIAVGWADLPLGPGTWQIGAAGNDVRMDPGYVTVHSTAEAGFIPISDGGSAIIRPISYRAATAHAKIQGGAARGTAGVPGYLLADDDVLEIGAYAWDGTAVLNNPVGRFRFYAAAAHGVGTIAGGLELRLNTGGAGVSDSSVLNITTSLATFSPAVRLAGGGLTFTDNTYDIGASGANRPRNVFIAGQIVVGTSATLTGSVGVGLGPNASIGLYVRSPALTSADQYGVYGAPTFTSAATSSAAVWVAEFKTAASAFAMGAGYGMLILPAALGAGSSVGTLYGLRIRSVTAGAANFALYTESGLVRFGDAVTHAGTTSFGGNVVSDLLFTDGTFDIGKTGATRPRDLFLSRDLSMSGSFTVSKSTTSGAFGEQGALFITTAVATSNVTHKSSPYWLQTGSIWNGAAAVAKSVGAQVQGLSGQNSQYLLTFGSTDVSDIMVLRGDSGWVGIGVKPTAALLHVEKALAGSFVGYVRNAAAAGSSYGLLIDAGGNAGDEALTVRDRTGASVFFNVTGAGVVRLGGNLTFIADSTYDIGPAGANRPRDVFLSRDLNAGQDVAVGRNLNMTSGAGDIRANADLYVTLDVAGVGGRLLTFRSGPGGDLAKLDGQVLATNGHTSLFLNRRDVGANNVVRVLWKDFAALAAGDKVLVA